VSILSQSDQGVFLINEVFLWKHALNMVQNSMRLFPWTNMHKYSANTCEVFFGNKALMSELKSTHFDVAIVDLVQNECQVHIYPI
jgi:hypothetical protein